MRRYLLFDSGCALCTAMAQQIAQTAEEWLHVRSLRDPEMQALVARSRSAWEYRPTLVEVEGETVRVYRGLGLILRLLRGLGWRRIWPIGEMMLYYNTTSVDGSRRRFLKQFGSFLVVVALGFPAKEKAFSKSLKNDNLEINLLDYDQINHILDEIKDNFTYKKSQELLNSFQLFADFSSITGVQILQNNKQIVGIIIPFINDTSNTNLILWSDSRNHSYYAFIDKDDKILILCDDNKNIDIIEKSIVQTFYPPQAFIQDNVFVQRKHNDEFVPISQSGCPPRTRPCLQCQIVDSACLGYCAACAVLTAACVACLAACARIMAPPQWCQGYACVGFCGNAAAVCGECAARQPCCRQWIPTCCL